jgi:hypothetical protein
MTKLIKELLAINKNTVEEATIDTSFLTRSKEFKYIKMKKPDLADQLELSWGYPEFYGLIRKIFDGAQIGQVRYNNLDDTIKTNLGILTNLHREHFAKFDMQLHKTIKPDVWGNQYERGFFRDMSDQEMKMFK